MISKRDERVIYVILAVVLLFLIPTIVSVMGEADNAQRKTNIIDPPTSYRFIDETTCDLFDLGPNGNDSGIAVSCLINITRYAEVAQIDRIEIRPHLNNSSATATGFMPVTAYINRTYQINTDYTQVVITNETQISSMNSAIFSQDANQNETGLFFIPDNAVLIRQNDTLHINITDPNALAIGNITVNVRVYGEDWAR